jgi:hypothetical protein
MDPRAVYMRKPQERVRVNLETGEYFGTVLGPARGPLAAQLYYDVAIENHPSLTRMNLPWHRLLTIREKAEANVGC